MSMPNQWQLDANAESITVAVISSIYGKLIHEVGEHAESVATI